MHFIQHAAGFLNKRFANQFYDWKPMRLVFDILHKNFQEDQLNSRRFPGGFLNSSRFPEYPEAVDTLINFALAHSIPLQCFDAFFKSRNAVHQIQIFLQLCHGPPWGAYSVPQTP